MPGETAPTDDNDDDDDDVFSYLLDELSVRFGPPSPTTHASCWWCKTYGFVVSGNPALAPGGSPLPPRQAEEQVAKTP